MNSTKLLRGFSYTVLLLSLIFLSFITMVKCSHADDSTYTYSGTLENAEVPSYMEAVVSMSETVPCVASVVKSVDAVSMASCVKVYSATPRGINGYLNYLYTEIEILSSLKDGTVIANKIKIEDMK